MRTKIVWLVLAAAILMKSETKQRQPVLVELFTSEGCSSCPPADALLARLDREQPIPGAQIIVLSEHVDYWDHLGWKDPNSSHAFTFRQETYDRRFGLAGPYTPEMVVDGAAECNGSDTRKVESAIRAAMQEPKVAVRVNAAGDSSVAIEVDPLSAAGQHKADIFLAHAAESGTSDVLRGENQGRRLSHVAIVKDVQRIGSVSEHAGFEKRIPAPAGSRIIVFVQEGNSGRVLGAAMH